MSQLDVRKIRILQSIVNDYVTTTKPVASERLLEAYPMGCKSATLRSEMAELCEMGYLIQPHTSAGRIPTDRGYRYYVDKLMNSAAAIAPEEARIAQKSTRKAQNEIAEIVLQTCRILTGLTSYPALATDPITETTRIQRVYLAEASPRRVLLVVLLSTGHVEHRLVDVEAAPQDTTLVRLSNYVNAQYAEQDLSELPRLLAAQNIPAELMPHTALLSKAAAALGQVVAALSERRVFLEGMSQILRQPEFADAVRLEALLATLTQRGALNKMLRRVRQTCDVTIIIGTENAVEAMQDCSIITTSYHIHNRPAGCLGVVGPTRMNYDRAAAAVGLMANSLSLLLTNLSLA